MMTNEEQHEKIERLERAVEALSKDIWEFKTGKRDRFAQNLVVMGLTLIMAILLLIYVAIDRRYKLERLRLAPGENVALSAPPAAANTDGTAKEPKQPNKPVSVDEQTPDAQRKLDNYIDREATGSKGGNSYSVTLGGLGEVINRLVKTGELTAEKASGLMQELGKNAISTSGDVLKEAAKAVIARYLGPSSEKEPKNSAGGPTQQVQVNVYGSEKHVTVSQPKKVQTPAKPKPSCPAPIPASKPVSCHVDVPSVAADAPGS
jgi:polyhydroxyalkanoate synthesis regulator phasin